MRTIFARALVMTAACCLGIAVTPALAAEICSNNNIDGVLNGPPRDSTPCSIPSPAHITAIATYHWNSAQGAAPGQIILRNVATGQEYGPFDAEGTPGQGGVPDAYWTAHIDITVPAGDYEVLDSDVASWSYNGASSGEGFITVTGEFTGDQDEGASLDDSGPDDNGGDDTGPNR